MPALVSETQDVKTFEFNDLNRLIDDKLQQLRSAKQTAEVQAALRTLTEVSLLTDCHGRPCAPNMEFPLLPID